MKFSVFSHADHYLKNHSLYSYGPYVKEMNFWISNFNQVEVVAPLSVQNPEKIDWAYDHNNIHIRPVPKLHYKNSSLLKSLIDTYRVLNLCIRAMKKTDHIHIRCPGNIGMIALITSSLFPSKPKTVKYAGNWDPESDQPFSYRFQKWWLSNTFLTRNAKVLVYGKWGNQEKNIIPFFTASFSEKENISINREFKAPYRFIFCGSLVKGKQPLLALKIVHQLSKAGIEVELDFYGEGPEIYSLQSYIKNNSIKYVTLHGNQNHKKLKAAYSRSHFCILPSKSEGWPKVLAEAMFFGSIPVSTKVSCVPWMLGYGERGVLIDTNLEKATQKLKNVLNSPMRMKSKSENAQIWSRKYTLERFNNEIHKIL